MNVLMQTFKDIYVKIKDHRNTLINLVVTLLTVALESIASNNIYKCPCNPGVGNDTNNTKSPEAPHEASTSLGHGYFYVLGIFGRSWSPKPAIIGNFWYGVLFLLVPAVVLLIIGYLLDPLTGRLITGLYGRKTNKTGARTCAFITIVIRSMIAPLAWLSIGLFDGRYLACALTSKPYTNSCDNVYGGTETFSLEYNINKAKSQMIGWAVLGIAFVLGAAFYTCASYHMKVTEWHRRFTSLTTKIEHEEFEKISEEMIREDAQSNIRKLIVEGNRKEDWDKATDLLKISAKGGKIDGFSSLDKWCHEQPTTSTNQTSEDTIKVDDETNKKDDKTEKEGGETEEEGGGTEEKSSKGSGLMQTFKDLYDVIKDYKHSLVNLITTVLTFALERIATINVFVCPCNPDVGNNTNITTMELPPVASNFWYGFFFLVFPALVLFLIGYLIDPLTGRLITGLSGRTTKRAKARGRTFVTIVIRSMIAPVAWVSIGLLSGKYMGCALSSKPYTEPCADVYKDTGTFSLDFHINKAISQMIGWGVLGASFILGAVLYTLDRYHMKVTEWHRRFMSVTKRIEHEEFEKVSEKMIRKDTQSNVRKLIKQGKKKEDWDKVTDLHEPSAKGGEIKGFSLLDEWCHDQPSTSANGGVTSKTAKEMQQQRSGEEEEEVGEATSMF